MWLLIISLEMMMSWENHPCDRSRVVLRVIITLRDY